MNKKGKGRALKTIEYSEKSKLLKRERHIEYKETENIKYKLI